MAVVLSNLGGGNAAEVRRLPEGDGDVSVKLNVTITGTRNGLDWPPRGGVITLPVSEAFDMIFAGMAEMVDSEPVAETASVEPTETATVKRPRAKKTK